MWYRHDVCATEGLYRPLRTFSAWPGMFVRHHHIVTECAASMIDFPVRRRVAFVGQFGSIVGLVCTPISAAPLVYGGFASGALFFLLTR